MEKGLPRGWIGGCSVGRGSKEINKAQDLLSKGVHGPMSNGKKGGGIGQCCWYGDNCILTAQMGSVQLSNGRATFFFYYKAQNPGFSCTDPTEMLRRSVVLGFFFFFFPPWAYNIPTSQSKRSAPSVKNRFHLLLLRKLY